MIIKECQIFHGMDMARDMMNSSVLPAPFKVKPYNVVDLSTRHILSEEEVYTCLHEAALREVSKLEGHYYRYLDHPIKPNGDAPNFINLPPKQRSKSFDSLHAQLESVKEYKQIKIEGYDSLTFRERSNTVPADISFIRCESELEASLVRLSRLATPSSPGSAKRKIQQKLQRDGKHQTSGHRSSSGSPSSLPKSHSRIPSSKLHSSSSLSMSEKVNDGKGSIITESNSEKRIPSSKLQHPSGSPFTERSYGRKITQPPENISERRSNPSHSNLPTMTKTNSSSYRPNLSRLSSKNSDTGSECSTDSGSCRSTPIYGNHSPSSRRSSKQGGDSPCNANMIPAVKANCGTPMKNKYGTFEKKKLSGGTIPMRREHTFDNVRQRKVSSPPILNASLQDSCDNISKPPTKPLSLSANTLTRTGSNSSILSCRSRNSSECSLDSVGNTKQKFESSTFSLRRSSIESNSSDSSDILKHSSSLKIPSSLSRPGSSTQKKTSTVSKQRSGIPSTSKKTSAEAKPNMNQVGVKHESKTYGIKKLSSPTPPRIKTGMAIIGNYPNLQLESEKKKPGNLMAVEKKLIESPVNSLRTAGKKSIESPLRHRRKLAYSKSDVTQSSQQKKNVKTNYRSNGETDLNRSGSSNIDASKIRCPHATNESLASARSSPKISLSTYSTKLRSPIQYSTNIENRNSNEIHFDAVENNDGVNAIDLKTIGGESSKEGETSDENMNVIEKANGEVKEILTETSKGNELEEDRINKQYKDSQGYLMENEFRTESTNSSRSSELDDGYSSLHKLDNLSPTLEDDCKHKKVVGIVENIKCGMEKEIELSSFINPNDRRQDDKVYSQAADTVSYIYAKPLRKMKEQTMKLKSPDIETLTNCTDKPSPDYDGLQSPHIGPLSSQSSLQGSLQVSGDPFGKAFDDFNHIVKVSPASSPFKRIPTKTLIPPPLLNSIAKDGGLAPVPSEYMRTPSSDGDEMQISNYYSGDLRQRAKEQAEKVWTKNAHFQEYSDFTRSSEQEKIIEKIDSNIFYSSNAFERKSIDPSPKFATRTSIHHIYDTSYSDATYPMEEVVSDIEKKKKSKLKKFLKKLSTKKEGRSDCESRVGNEHFLADSYSLASVNSLPSHLSNNVYCEGIDDMRATKSPSFRRRMFTFNLNFMKKSRRQRLNSVFLDDSTDTPSNIVRALCSPEMNCRKELNFMQHSRRGSDPSAYQFQGSPKKNIAPNPPSSSEVSDLGERTGYLSEKNNADYINYPFSKLKITAPIKPQRQIKGSSAKRCLNSSCNMFDTTINKEGEKLTCNVHTSFPETEIQARRSNIQSSQSSNKFLENMCHNVQLYENVSLRYTGSLRRTPLRSANDNYSKILEVHKQTVDKIAYEVASLRCECETLHGLEWEDFERVEELIQLGINSYMVVPVTCSLKSIDKQTFYAWLHFSPQHSLGKSSEYPLFNFSRSTLHRNCLHACHIMEQDYSSPFQDGIPKSIQIDCVYISKQCPKMTLSKYISMTLEKHGRYAEIYEREVALMLLQIIKGIQNLYTNDVFISSIDSENIFVMNNGEPSIVLSPRREPNKCPALAVCVLPGIGDVFRNTAGDSISSICHQLAFLLYELMHCPYQDELRDAVDMSMLLATLPDLTIKSIYSRYLQYVINILLGTSSHTTKSLEDLQIILEIILFGPSDISECSENETVILINKWHNRRCVDMVTHILKEAPLIMVCASDPSAHDIEKLKNVDQEILLECEFLSHATSSDIYRVSKMLDR